MKNVIVGFFLGIILTVCLGAVTGQSEIEYLRQITDSLQRMQRSLEIIAQKTR
jgi:ABC-type nitrate/sulfonate/bicarbonate transport system permease component